MILTKDPAEELKWLHDRMPVMLQENHIREWVDPDELQHKFLTEMIWIKMGG